MKQEAITVRLEHDLEPLLDQVCRRSGRTRSDVFREALRRYLAQLRFEQLRRRVMQHVLRRVENPSYPDVGAVRTEGPLLRLLGGYTMVSSKVAHLHSDDARYQNRQIELARDTFSDRRVARLHSYRSDIASDGR